MAVTQKIKNFKYKTPPFPSKNTTKHLKPPHFLSKTASKPLKTHPNPPKSPK
jgi:hypothetical protein